MRTILAGLFYVSLAFSEEMLQTELFFPPDPERSISETKPKPMVSRRENIVLSGSQTPVSTGMANRVKKSVDKSSPDAGKSQSKTPKKAKSQSVTSKKL